MSKFAEITSIDQVLRAISGSDEFIVKRDTENGLLIVNYIYNTPTTFPDPSAFETEEGKLNAKLRRECRGIEFDLESGDIVTRKYHKFFNISEKPETQPDLIDWNSEHWILDKLDGSLISPYKRNGKIQYHTKMGFTDVAQPVNAFVRSCTQYNYDKWCESIIESGYSPLFEWCSRKQRIVIDYDQDQLVLTAIRNNRTGEYVPYPMLLEIAANHVPVVRAWPGNVENIHEFIRNTRALQGAEGCVLRFADGAHYKVKGEWYCLIHGTKDALASEKNVWAMVLENTVDDAKAFMEADDRSAVDAFTEAFGDGVEQTAHRIRDRVAALRREHDSKKSFALAITKDASIPSLERSMMFSIWDGQEPVDVVLKVLRNNIGTATKIDGVRDLVGGVRWDRFYKAVVDED